MSAPEFDPRTLSVHERLHMIDALWKSIEEALASGDASVARAVEQWRDAEPDLMVELEQEADQADNDPSSQTSWSVLLEEMKQKKE